MSGRDCLPDAPEWLLQSTTVGLLDDRSSLEQQLPSLKDLAQGGCRGLAIGIELGGPVQVRNRGVVLNTQVLVVATGNLQ